MPVCNGEYPILSIRSNVPTGEFNVSLGNYFGGAAIEKQRRGPRTDLRYWLLLPCVASNRPMPFVISKRGEQTASIPVPTAVGEEFERLVDPFMKMLTTLKNPRCRCRNVCGKAAMTTGAELEDE
jgi:hypothetical protein